MPNREDVKREGRKVRWGTVPPEDSDTEGLTDAERRHEGALDEAAHPPPYPDPGVEEAHWAAEQLNRGPSSDYVGHNRRVENLPEGAVAEAPEGTVAKDRRERPRR